MLSLLRVLIFLTLRSSFVCRLELYWVNGKEMTVQNPNMVNGQSIVLNSYVNHTFMVRGIPDASGECKVEGLTTPSSSPVCRTAYLTVNDHEDQGKFTVDDHIHIILFTLFISFCW